MKNIIKHIKNRTIFNIIIEKVFFKFINFFTKNENTTTLYIQNHNFIKLKNKYKKYIQNYKVNLKKEKSNKIWFCWLQGFDKAPDLVKACYNSLVENMPDNEIIFLSEGNISQYIKFPDFINKKYLEGKIGRAHYSDLLRISLLCEYGGTWIDSTVLCTSKDFSKFIINQPFFVFKQVDLNRKGIQPIVASNWLISSEKNNEICLLTRDLLFNYWKKNNYAKDYFIFHFFFTMATEKYSNIWNSLPTFNNINPHILQFELNNKYTVERWNQITNYSGFHKLNHHLNYNCEDTNYSMILKKYINNKGK